MIPRGSWLSRPYDTRVGCRRHRVLRKPTPWTRALLATGMHQTQTCPELGYRFTIHVIDGGNKGQKITTPYRDNSRTTMDLDTDCCATAARLRFIVVVSRHSGILCTFASRLELYSIELCGVSQSDAPTVLTPTFNTTRGRCRCGSSPNGLDDVVRVLVSAFRRAKDDRLCLLDRVHWHGALHPQQGAAPARSPISSILRTVYTGMKPPAETHSCTTQFGDQLPQSSVAAYGVNSEVLSIVLHTRKMLLVGCNIT